MSQRPLFERPLDKLLPPKVAATKSPTQPRATATRDRQPAELVTIAGLQRWNVILGFLAHWLPLLGVGVVIGVSLIPDVDELFLGMLIVAGALTWLGLLAAHLVVFFRLALRVLDPGAFAVDIILIFLIGLFFTSVILHFQTNAVFRKNGLRTGFFGVNRAALREIDPRNQHESQLPRLGW